MISLVIPAYNEEKRLPKTLECVFFFLTEEKIEAEVIVVNDGSKDNTEQVVKDLFFLYPNLRLVSYLKNKGKGGAVKEGVMAAKGDSIVFLDADNSTSIEELKPMIKNLSDHDVVIGSRKISGAQILKKQPLMRRILGNGFNLFVKVILGLSDYSDTQCGFKGFKNSAAKSIFSKIKISGFAFDTEVLCIARNSNFKILEMPIVWRDEAESTLKIKSLWKIFLDVLRIKYNSLRGVYGGEKMLSRMTLKDIFLAILFSEISLVLISLVVDNILKTGKNETLLFIALPFLVFFIMTLGKILSQRIYEFIKFSVVGVLNTAIDFAILNLLSFFFNIFSGPLIILFNIASFLCAVLNSYFLNKYWTFHAKNTKLSKEWLLFAVVSIVSAIASTAVVYLGTTLFKHWGGDYVWLNFIKAIAVIFSTFINFLGYKFFVFKES